tara:strand:- start:846 stop:1367 length:522 start_codon:yes stop_codon:yes gene_type:complete
MRSSISIFTFALIAGFAILPSPAFSEGSSEVKYKVLAKEEDGFNVYLIDHLIREGDKANKRNDFDKAKENYDKARDISKRLLSFYRDLSGSFRGLDARIPREMDAKGRKSLEALAKANLRLAALFRQHGEPEVAVPLLVEVVRIMTPAKPYGREAYEDLLELGFADTPYTVSR